MYPFLLSIRSELSTECLVTALGPSASALTKDSPPAASSQHSSQGGHQVLIRCCLSTSGSSCPGGSLQPENKGRIVLAFASLLSPLVANHLGDI